VTPFNLRAEALGLAEDSEQWPRLFDAARRRGDLPPDIRHMADRRLVPALFRTIDNLQLGDDDLCRLANSISASKRWEPHIRKRLDIEMAKRFEVSEMAVHYRLEARTGTSMCSPLDQWLPLRTTWWYSVSRSIGTRPASVIRRRISATVASCGVSAPAS